MCCLTLNQSLHCEIVTKNKKSTHQTRTITFNQQNSTTKQEYQQNITIDMQTHNNHNAMTMKHLHNEKNTDHGRDNQQQRHENANIM